MKEDVLLALCVSLIKLFISQSLPARFRLAALSRPLYPLSKGKSRTQSNDCTRESGYIVYKREREKNTQERQNEIEEKRTEQKKKTKRWKIYTNAWDI